MTLEENNESFYDEINPLLQGIYEEAQKDDSHNQLQFLEDTDGRYCESDLCGEGGMKKVFAADDNFSGRQVAMARLKEMKNSDSFLREVRLLARLEHPNIVPLYDVGVDESQEPYIIMKLLGGCRFSDIFQKMAKSKEEYDLPYLLEIFLKVCDATAYAHSRDIIHADIKPENIQIDDYGSVLLCDWGLACDLQNEVILSRRQSSGKAEGTPGSMAPEQLSDEFGPLSKQTDIYSLGCLLYSILSLKPPLAGENLESVIDKTLAGEIPEVPTVSSRSVPRALAAVTSHAMSLQPQDRYNSVATLTQEIRSYMSGFATVAEDAGLLKRSLLFYMRNQRSCSITIVSLALIFLIVSVFVGEVENREQLTNAALKEVAMERSVKDSLSKIAEEKLMHRAYADFKNLNIYGAKKLAEEALALNLQSKTAHMLMGKIYFSFYKFADAEKHFSKAGEEEFYYRTLNRKMINREMTGQELIKLMVKQYNDIAVCHQLPKVYKTLKKDQKVEYLLSLIAMYRTGGQKITSNNVNYSPEKKTLEIKNVRLRNLAFLYGLNLEKVSLQNCLIDDSRILSFLKIKSIDLQGSLVKGIDEIKTKETQYFNVSGTNILSHYFMDRQHAIETLDVSHTQLIWFSKLNNVLSLKTLVVDLKQSKLSTMKGLRKGIKVVIKNQE
jgi:hypothetical protein